MEMATNSIDLPYDQRAELLSSHDHEDGPRSPTWGIGHSRRRGLGVTLLALGLASFLVYLDEAIISPAIPKVTDEFDSLGDIGWYGSGYMLLQCAFQLQFGRLYSFFPMDRVFLTSTAIFELGALICGTSTSSIMFIIGRAISGLGASGISSGTLIILSHLVPPHKLPSYLGGLGAIYGIAAAIGPVVGGLLTDSSLTWRWCFYMNLPIGAAAACAIVCSFHPSMQKENKLTIRQKLAKLDPIGTVLFVPAIVCFLVALQQLGRPDLTQHIRLTVGLSLASFILGVTFIAVQIWKQEDATVPPRIITNKTVAFASLYGLCIDGSFYILIYYTPIWFQAVQQTSAKKSGIYTLPLTASSVISTIISGTLVTMTRQYVPFMIASPIVAVAGMAMLCNLHVSSTPSYWAPAQVLAGLGIGLGTQQPLVAVQSHINQEDLPVALAIILLFQWLGPAVSVSIAQAVFEFHLARGIRDELPNIDQQFAHTAGAINLKDLVVPELIPLFLQIYNEALQQIWKMAAALTAFSIIGALLINWGRVRDSPSYEEVLLSTLPTSGNYEGDCVSPDLQTISSEAGSIGKND